MHSGRIRRLCTGVALVAAAAAALLLGGARPAGAFGERPAQRIPQRPDSAMTSPAPAGGAAGQFDAVPAPTAAPAPAMPPARPKKVFAYTDLWRFGRSQRVHEDEVVRGQVVVLGGNLRVDGEITGGAVVIAGDIDVGPRGRIGGQTVAVAGRVTSAPGSEVHGALSLSTFSTPLFRRFGDAIGQETGLLVSELVKMFLLVLVAMLLQRALGRYMENARREFAARRLRCVGLGLFALPAAVFSAIVLAFLLALSVAGMPVALLLLAGTGGVSLVALLVGASSLGVWMVSRSRPVALPTWRHLALGLIALRIPGLVAGVLRWGAPDSGLAFAFEIVDVTLALAVLAGGLGGLLLARWGPNAAPPEPVWAGGA